MAGAPWTVTVTLQLSAQDVSDVLTAAFEGGIDHWCDTVRRTAPSARRYACEALAMDGVPLALVTQEGDTYLLDRAALCRGLGLYAQKHGWPEDLGDIDAEAADLIVQYAVFGEVMYS